MRAILFSLMLGLMPVSALAADQKLALANSKPTPTDAKTKPAPDEVRRVINYYFNGKGQGPVLMDTKLCRDIKQDGNDKNECVSDITTQSIKKGDSVYLWMAYMVPSNDETQNIVILFEKGGVTRSVESLQVSSQLRNRAWLKISFDKPGPWILKVVRDTGSGAEVLGMLDVTVR